MNLLDILIKYHIKSREIKLGIHPKILNHKLGISKFYKQKDDFNAKRKFYRLLFQDNMNLYETIMKKVRKLGQYNQITILWILSQIERRNNLSTHNIKRGWIT